MDAFFQLEFQKKRIFNFRQSFLILEQLMEVDVLFVENFEFSFIENASNLVFIFAFRGIVGSQNLQSFFIRGNNGSDFLESFL